MFHIDIAIIHCTLKGKQYVVGVARQIVLSLYQISLTKCDAGENLCDLHFDSCI